MIATYKPWVFVLRYKKDGRNLVSTVAAEMQNYADGVEFAHILERDGFSVTMFENATCGTDLILSRNERTTKVREVLL